MRTIVYIDGLNFYYGCTRNTNLKWVDLMGLSQTLLGEQNDIVKIKLFSAMVKPTQDDPSVHIRQKSYFRALQAYIPEIEIIMGHFSEHVVNMKLAPPIGDKKFAGVVKREEKGSDVNLAVHFLFDALRDKYDCGVIISNDSDLAEAVRLVRAETNKKIGIISPYKTVSKDLAQYSHFQRIIRKGALEHNQMPEKIPNTNLTRPQSWQ